MPTPVHQLFPSGQGLLEGCAAVVGGLVTIGLFKNTPFLQRGFNPVNITECDFGGYSRQSLGTWGTPGLDTNNNAIASAATVTWTYTGLPVNNPVTGFFYMDSAGVIQWAQYFLDGPYQMQIIGDLIRVTPNFYFGGPLLVESEATDP